jgi:hypothetical protein
MSLYKVIGNYYTDMLDYLNNASKASSGGLAHHFDNMKTLQQQQEFVIKTALLIQRLDILQAAETDYYATTQKNNMTYFILIIVVLIVAALSMLYMYLTNYRYSAEFRVFSIKNGIVYLLSYVILFTLLLLLLTNIQASRVSSNNRSEELRADTFPRFYRLLGIGNEQRLLRISLLYISYTYTQNKSKRDSMFKALSNDEKKELSTYVNGDIVNYAAFYEKWKPQFKQAMLTFFDNGNGYHNLKKEITTSSNILILKELNNILKYFYSVCNISPNVDIDEQQKLTNQTMINKYVVGDLVLLDEDSFKQIDIVNSYVTVSDATRESANDTIVQSEKNEEFMKQLDLLVELYVYVYVYLYQIKLKIRFTDPAFPSALVSKMPMKIDLSTVKPDMKDEYEYVVNQFQLHFEQNMTIHIDAASKITDNAKLETIYQEALTSLTPLFDNQYLRVLMMFKGNYYFMYDPAYLSGKIRTKLDVLSLNPHFEAAYITTMDKQINDFFIPQCYTLLKSRSNQGVETLENAVVARISSNLMNTNIKVAEYIQYALDALSAQKGVDNNLRGIYLSILQRIDKEVQRRRDAKNLRVGEASSKARFRTVEEFVRVVDDLSYNEFKNHVDADFFQVILEEFYKSVSSAIYDPSKRGTIKDIYFNDEKNMKIALRAIVMVCIILALGVGYFYTSLQFDGKAIAYQLSKLKEEANKDGIRDDRRKEIGREIKEYNDLKVDLIIKYAIPAAAYIFVCSLLISYFRKADVAMRFNKDTIDSNTASLRSSVKDLKELFDKIDLSINTAYRNNKIKTLSAITIEQKNQMYRLFINIIDKYEKCNYVVMSSKVELPFPYTEVVIDTFMVVLTLLCILFVIAKFAPLQRFKNIKTLNGLLEKGQYADGDEAYVLEVKELSVCHNEEIESIIFTLKIIFFLMVFMFLLFYSSKIFNSSNQFMYGLYNSMYFEESRCYE